MPDIESPETEPEYVIDFDPTVPKLIVLPLVAPWIPVGVLPNPEIMIVPLRYPPNCCHVNLNVPLKEPL